jgi:hypothetical protein
VLGGSTCTTWHFKQFFVQFLSCIYVYIYNTIYKIHTLINILSKNFQDLLYFQLVIFVKIFLQLLKA